MEKGTKITSEQKKIAYQEIVPIAQHFRQRILPETQKVNDSFGLVEKQLGYFILRFPSSDTNLSGFHIKKSGIHCIYVNSNQVLGRQYFSLWHECYHAEQDQVGVSFLTNMNTDINEYKAECFAGCILMPEGLVADYINDQRLNLNYASHNELIKMQHWFGVSYSAIITRLIQLYPTYQRALGSRFALGQVKRHHELEEKTKNLQLSTTLIKPTKDTYVSSSFIEDIKFNLAHNRISQEKAMSLMEMLESIGTLNEH